LEKEMRVLEINGAVALNLEPGDVGSLWKRLAAFMAARIAATRIRRSKQACERELARLPDHLLTDIGVRRSELTSARPRWVPDAFVIYGPDAYSRVWGDHSWR
jgi:uncharacterized protein YjiS (DUF1127 family)